MPSREGVPQLGFRLRRRTDLTAGRFFFWLTTLPLPLVDFAKGQRQE